MNLLVIVFSDEGHSKRLLANLTNEEFNNYLTTDGLYLNVSDCPILHELNLRLDDSNLQIEEPADNRLKNLDGVICLGMAL